MENGSSTSHKMNMEQRKYVGITGVCDVVSFDLKHILLETTMGMLEIKGNELKVKKVSLDSGEFQVTGTIDSLQYSDIKNFKQKGKSFIKKAFR